MSLKMYCTVAILRKGYDLVNSSNNLFFKLSFRLFYNMHYVNLASKNKCVFLVKKFNYFFQILVCYTKVAYFAFP